MTYVPGDATGLYLPRVLHISEAWGAGVRTAIMSYAAHTGASHSLIGKCDRNAPSFTPDGVFVRLRLERSIVAFVFASRRELAGDYDIVHLHSSIAGLFRLLPSVRAKRVIYSPHALASTHHRRRWVRTAARLVERVLARRSDILAAVSHQEFDDLASWAGRLQRTVLVPHAVQVISATRHRDRKPRILAMGRLCYQKNPGALLDLPGDLAAALGDKVSYEFVWVGGGDELLANRLRRSGWTVTGWVDRDLAQSMLEESMVLVHPALYEGLPLVVLEAMAAGTPVVAHDIAAFRDVIGPRYYRSRDEMLTHIVMLLSQPREWHEASDVATEYVRREFSRESQDAALAILYGDQR